MWLQAAPVLESIVVSEIGEQWSPNTEPASVADKAMIVRCGATDVQIDAIIGIRIPNVPQLVPIENERKAATTNIIAGISIIGMLEASTMLLT